MIKERKSFSFIIRSEAKYKEESMFNFDGRLLTKLDKVPQKTLDKLRELKQGEN